MRAYFTHENGFGRWGFIEHHARKLAKVPDHRTLATFGGSNLPHVWLGTSVEDQKRADERIPQLLATPAAVRWLSCEPLLGHIDLQHLHISEYVQLDALTGIKFDELGPRAGGDASIDWVVAGGESGPGARPMHPDWARSLRDQCAAAGVPFLFKQWGAFTPSGCGPVNWSDGEMPGHIAWPDGTIGHGRAEDHGGQGEALTHWHHKRDAGRLLDGQLHDGFPA
jgi:protein gp37